ncbi:MAG: DUF255 domain-containing protein [Chromatiaceae bacterium]|nr:DUF255 domain-containing protein [Chromatiaceae bacterium]
MVRTFHLLLVWVLAGPVLALENQLRDHPSPYLAMHGNDPVAWQEWGPAALELARKEGRLLFISSGYFSCHWCHVMQRESYRNAKIADILNTYFVPVKVDRELNGALDAYLIDFVEKTQGHAGWPLNVFLTPEGYPLIGMTYLPPERFQQALQRLNTTWQDERGQMRNLARRTLLQLMLNREQVAEVEPLSGPVLQQDLLRQALSIADTMEGGFGDQNKFPMTPQLLALLDLQAAAPNQQLAEFLTLTLDKMAGEGLRDHLAGGFFRYTVDPSWQVPHFEKMLYTQAQLAEVYLRAAQVLGRDDYAEVAHDTLQFVSREMTGPQGGYVASFSAVDGAGEEGGVYLWTVDQLHAVLGEADTALARRYWRMQDLAPLDGGHLPRRGESLAQIAAATGQTEADLAARIASIRARLLAVRGQRVLPVDRKELAGWNGLMLAAFAQAAKRWDDPLFRDAAKRTRDFLKDRLWDGQRLRRALANDQPLGEASLEDYAYVAYGMDRYAELSHDPVDRTLVAALLHLAWQRYQGPGGWRMDDQPLLPGLGEEPAMAEGALPAPSAVLIRLAAHSDAPDLVEKALAAADLARQQAQAEPFWYAGHHAALLEMPGPPAR